MPRGTAAQRIAWTAAGLAAAMGIGGLAATKLLGFGVIGSAPAFLVAWVLSFALIGALIVSKQPKNVFGWIFTVVALLITFDLAGTAYGDFAAIAEHGAWPAGVAIAWLAGGWNWIPISALLLIFIPLLYPTGLLLSSRWRFVVWCAAAFVVLAAIPNALMPGPLFDNPAIRNPLGLDGFAGFLDQVRTISLIPAIVGVIGALASLVLRFRRARGQERQQLKWFLYGCVLFMIPLLIRGPVPNQVQQLLTIVLWPALPISVGVAILKYRLYDIDLVISKSLVYGALAAFITAVYVVIVVGIGTLIGASGKPNLALSIIATAVVSVAFQPVRERLRRLTNRLVFGERATPYQVIADFAERMAGVLSIDEVLPKMAELVARGVGATQVRVRFILTGAKDQVGIWPPGGSAAPMDLVVPATYRGDALGEIGVTKKAGEALTPAERKLLADLATQAGLVLHNVRLAIDLHDRLNEVTAQAVSIHASRQRIVAAQDMERRRLEGTIHKGAEAQLLAIDAQLDRLANLLSGGDKGTATTLLQHLTAEANETLEGLRDVARGIYPPLLRERGLAAALRAQVAKLQLQVEVTADDLVRYPAEVEAAGYFCCVEGLRSASGPATIRLAATADELDFCLTAARLDLEGRFQDMEDRIEALGGKLAVAPTQLRVQIPIRTLEPIG